MRTSRSTYRHRNRKFPRFLVFIVVIALLGGVYLYMGGVPMKTLFTSEVQTELSKSTFAKDVFTENDIAELPEPVQRYFRTSGFIGKRKMANAKVVYKDVEFAQCNQTLTLYSEQYNFV